MRENRTYGSEGGAAIGRSDPIGQAACRLHELCRQIRCLQQGFMERHLYQLHTARRP